MFSKSPTWRPHRAVKVTSWVMGLSRGSTGWPSSSNQPKMVAAGSSWSSGTWSWERRSPSSTSTVAVPKLPIWKVTVYRRTSGVGEGEGDAEGEGLPEGAGDSSGPGEPLGAGLWLGVAEGLAEGLGLTEGLGLPGGSGVAVGAGVAVEVLGAGEGDASVRWVGSSAAPADRGAPRARPQQRVRESRAATIRRAL